MIGATFFSIFLWLLAMWGETYFFSFSAYINPNLFFLFVVLLVLHWRGRAGTLIAIGFGLGADCFSTLPFGLFGALFFLFYFPLRFYSKSLFVENGFTVVISTGFCLIGHSFLLYLALSIMFHDFSPSFAWFSNQIFSEILPTTILCYPCYRLLLRLERAMNLRFSPELNERTSFNT